MNIVKYSKELSQKCDNRGFEALFRTEMFNNQAEKSDEIHTPS